MKEPVEVVARFDPHGKIYPVRVSMRGQAYSIDDVGRRWQDEEGLHILVIVASARVWELVFNAQESRWYLNSQMDKTARI